MNKEELFDVKKAAQRLKEWIDLQALKELLKEKKKK